MDANRDGIIDKEDLKDIFAQIGKEHDPSHKSYPSQSNKYTILLIVFITANEIYES